MAQSTHMSQFFPHKFEAFPEEKEKFERVFNEYHRVHGEPSDPIRILNFMQYVNIANDAPDGDYLELGTHQGFAAKVIWEFMDRSKNFYCLDTFEGFQEVDLVEERKVYANNWEVGNFPPTSPESVKAYITHESDTSLHMIKGWFPEAFKEHEDKKWRFVHIDFDLYAPIKSALEILWDKIVPGGVCMIHDYGCYGFPGAKKAVDEFFNPRGIVPHVATDRWGTAIIVKSTQSSKGEVFSRLRSLFRF